MWLLHSVNTKGKNTVWIQHYYLLCLHFSQANDFVLYRESFMEVMNDIEDWLLCAVQLKTMMYVYYGQY